MKGINMKKNPLMALGIAIAAATTCFGAQATTIDLTASGNFGTLNGATYRQVITQPAGSGVIDSFVRIQTNDGIEQGYNTTVNGVYDNNSSDTFNHEITVGQVGFIDLNGGDEGGEVMRFLLDINQANSTRNDNKSRLNLDEVQIYLSRTANQFIEPTLGQGDTIPFADSTLLYQMDVGGNHVVTLDGLLHSGSGTGDMYLDIPLAMFMTAFGTGGYNTTDEQNGAFIYLYSRFGTDPNENTSGFEEWAAIRGTAIQPPCDPTVEDCGGPPTDIPEPGSLALLGVGLVAAGYLRRRKHPR
jgi:hypothetical protein